MLGSLLTKWTIRLSLAFYVAYLAGWLCRFGSRWPATARILWTVSCVLFDVHVACAFHFRHEWSHAAAWQHTADRTEELMGFAFGNGIFFSYLFLGLWLFDVIWLWVSPAGSQAGSPPGSARPVPPMTTEAIQTPWWRVLVHIFLFFIVVNGAIVFEGGPTRWAGIAALLALATLAAWRAYRGNSVAKTKCLTASSTNCPAEA